MVRFFGMIFCVLFPLFASAQMFGQKPPMLKSKEPVSLSYREIIKCRPDLKDSRLKTQVSLEILKELIDLKFPTQKSQLKSRLVEFRESTGERRRLILDNKSTLKQTKWQAQWFSVSETGETEIWEAKNLKEFPSLKEVHGILAQRVIENDQTSTEDTKVKGLVFHFRKDLHSVLDLRLEDRQKSWSLSCETKEKLGTICHCYQKKPLV